MKSWQNKWAEYLFNTTYTWNCNSIDTIVWCYYNPSIDNLCFTTRFTFNWNVRIMSKNRGYSLLIDSQRQTNRYKIWVKKQECQNDLNVVKWSDNLK